MCDYACVCVLGRLQLISISGCGIASPACFYMQFPLTQRERERMREREREREVERERERARPVCVCVLCAQLAPKSTKSTNQTKKGTAQPRKTQIKLGGFFTLLLALLPSAMAAMMATLLLAPPPALLGRIIRKIRA